MHIFVRHWRGRLPLWRSIYLILVLPSAAVLALCAYYERYASQQFVHPATDSILVYSGAAVVACLLIWQIVGTLRSADQFLLDGGDRGLAMGAQGIVLIIVLAMTILAVDTYQALRQRTQAYERFQERNSARDFTLKISEDNRRVRIAGSLEVGVTTALAAILDLHPDIVAVELNSFGGRVYEGRALMKLIRARNLDTYLLGECYSACAMAFLGGKNRIMHPDAILGFHQYRSYTVQPNVDVETEQAKDIELMIEQGVRASFANAVFEVASEDIWIPDLDALTRNAVVTRVADADTR